MEAFPPHQFGWWNPTFLPDASGGLISGWLEEQVEIQREFLLDERETEKNWDTKLFKYSWLAAELRVGKRSQRAQWKLKAWRDCERAAPLHIILNSHSTGVVEVKNLLAGGVRA